MLKVAYFCVFMSIYLPISLSKRQLPSFLKVCNRRDPLLDDCIKEAIYSLKPYLGKGVPEMRIASFDPLHVTHLELNNGNVNFQYDDLDFYKMDDFEIETVHMDFDSCSANMDTIHRDMSTKGLYKVKGRLLVFELEGAGKVNVNFTDVRMSTKMNCTRQLIKNKEYAKFDGIDVNLKIGGYNLFFSDIFRNNPELTERTNAVLNENSDTLLPEFEPIISAGVKEIIQSTVQAVFDRFSLDELIPE